MENKSENKNVDLCHWINYIKGEGNCNQGGGRVE